MPKIKQDENTVKRAIREYLEFNGYTDHRINNGAIWNKKRKCYIFHGTPGVADDYYTKDGENDLWVEGKATGKKPSEAQCKFGERVNRSRGSVWIWADSLDVFISEYIRIIGIPK